MSLRGHQRGFTLLELLVTIAIAAILLAVAIPSYRGLVERNAMAARVNDLVGDLNYARSQAVTRGAPVYLCKSTDRKNCASSGDWGQGWIVFAPDPNTASNPEPTPDNVLRVRRAASNSIKITGNNNIENQAFFDANGFAMGSIGTFTFTAERASQTVIIAGAGRIRSEPVVFESGS